MSDPSAKPDLLIRRRAALGLLASGAFLPLAGCDQPDEEILPYVKMPERLVPGVPLRFATSLPLGGFGRGMIVTSWQGRPTKVEGNPAHPGSQGATDVFAEAAVLELYDPDRSRNVRLRPVEPGSSGPDRPRSGPVAWNAFLSALVPRLATLEATQGEGLRILTGNLTSPTMLRLLRELKARFPRMRRYQHEAIAGDNTRAGAVQAFGRPLRSLAKLERASVILAMDSDPLGPGPDQIRMGRGFAARRMVRKAGAGLSRLYAVEPVMTTTGAKADHRLAVPPDQVLAVALALAAALGAPLSPPPLDGSAAKFVAAVADDLRAHQGEAVVLVGEWQPPEVHALAHWINLRLQAPVDYLLPPELDSDDPPGTIGDLVKDLQHPDPADVLCVLGANSAYDAPASLGVEEAIRRTPFSVHMGLWRDETAQCCTWHLPVSHALEEWGDLRSTDGTVGIVQPLIRPLHATRSGVWLLGALGGQLDLTAYAAVRATWAAERPDNFEAWWRKALHDGVVPDTAPAPLTVAEAKLPDLASGALRIQPSASGLTLALRPDASVFDGRDANNAWLQECPRPITTQVWGNVAMLAPDDAAARGIKTADLVKLTLEGRTVTVPALVQPGQAAGVVLLALGYGRRNAGAIGDGVGADAYSLRRPEQPWYAGNLALDATAHRGDLLLLQAHRQLEAEADELLPSLTLQEWENRPEPDAHAPAPASLFPALQPDDTYGWGMVIDNTLCIGCNACVVACQSENNVPIVGPEQIAQNRDMHWLRIDTYDIGSETAPRPGFVPVPCMHCEKAPCEPVCPVAASVHDSEGLNVQVYNRCIGTRFCQANCPYKVRHFNFYGYANEQAYANQGADLVAAQRNPDVTVRSRGVMEKCTYCVQRISAARRAAEKEDRTIAEGEVETACQRACPTHAIQFGDLHKPDSVVARLRRQKQHYAMLGHLGTRPRTTYLADIRNPNPAVDT